MSTLTVAVGRPVSRIEGAAKVTGQARYAADFPLAALAYGWVVQSTIARGRVHSVDAELVLGMPGVLAVITHENALPLEVVDDGELLVLQDRQVHYRGQIVALVVATALEQARAGADALPVRYEAEPHDVLLSADHPGLFAPDHVNPNFPTDTLTGDVEASLARAEVVVDQTYSTPAEHNNPMEPHATTAYWDGDRLTVYDSNQGATRVHQALVHAFRARRQWRTRRLRACRWGVRVEGQHPPAHGAGGHGGANARPSGPGHPESSAAVLAWSATAPRPFNGSGWAPTPADGWPPWTTRCSSRPPRCTSSPSRPP